MLGGLVFGACGSSRLPLPEAPLPRVSLDAPLRSAWRTNADAAFGETPALVEGGVAYVGTRKGEVLAVRLASGKILARYDVHDAVETAPVLLPGNRLLVLPASRQRPRVLTLGSTSTASLPERSATAAFATPASLVLVQPSGTVLGYAPASLEEQWRVAGTSPVAAVAACEEARPCGNVLLVIDRSGTARLIDPATGQGTATFHVAAPVLAAALFEGAGFGGDGPVAVVTTGRGQVVAARTGDAAPLWTYAHPDPTVRLTAAVRATGEAGRALLVVGGTDGAVRALDARTGALVWQHAAGSPVVGAPAVDGNRVYAGTLGRTLVVLDASTGEERQVLPVGGRVRSSPLVTGSGVLVFSEPSHFYHFVPAANAPAADASIRVR